MERWWAWRLIVVAMVTAHLAPCRGVDANPEFLSTTLINNVVVHPATGRLYVGAINNLYQLSADLELESSYVTGPKLDNRQCTPPVTTVSCKDAKETPNYNKLLLLHPAKNQLVVCGSLFRGLCSLRSLDSVQDEVYFNDNKGEKSYVASADETVSVVGVMSYYKKNNENLTVFLVAKGHSSLDNMKLISTRVLEEEGDWDVFENIIETAAVQSNPFNVKYAHDFRFSFKSNGFVYFLFSRKLNSHNHKNFTFISRICEEDHNYYSYTELQLNCSAGNEFSKVLAAFVGPAGETLAESLSRSPRYGSEYGPISAHDEVLFATFSNEDDNSAMCMYPLKFIDAQIYKVIDACYNHGGLINNQLAVYSPYSTSNSKPEELCSGTRGMEKCGAEHLPSPLASKAEFALVAEPSWTHGRHLTAVAVAVEMDHAVAFLGTVDGQVLKLHLSAQPKVYGQPLSSTSRHKVNKNLLFDSSLQHLYITTDKKITKVPVQTCHLMTDCHSCVQVKDPYCGWCVLEGRCTTKQACSRSAETNAWLWSPNGKCVEIAAFDPPNISCKKTNQVSISVPSLPRLRTSDKLHCVFNSLKSDAVTRKDDPTMVVCSLPDPGKIPPTPEQQDFVSVPMKILLNETVEVTSGEYHFYNCAATVWKNPNTPCISCVTSQWGCQWNTKDYTCGDKVENPEDHIVKPSQRENCPQFESPEPLLIPVGYKVPIVFQGRNLESYEGKSFTIGTELMGNTEENVMKTENSKFRFNGYQFAYNDQQEVNISFHIKDQDRNAKIDSTLTVTLYSCSVGREDCSLCKHADDKYNCEWCEETPHETNDKENMKCVYKEICKSSEPTPCPEPTITDVIPRFGPLNGSIAVTIKGSNMGIKKEDVKKITVAGVNCKHLEDRYSVSTSVVCEIGPKRTPPSDLPPDTSRSGPVMIEVEGNRSTISGISFTYRDPDPKYIHPKEGPAAGGTNITITGDNLDTATKDDVTVSIGGIACDVLSFGTSIICKTGSFSAAASFPVSLKVTVKYGRNTIKTLLDPFNYTENPKITGYSPNTSFFCGGRRIVVTGTGFNLIQSVSMKALFNTNNGSTVENKSMCKIMNDSVLECNSPKVSSQPVMTQLHLDNVKENLTFKYYPDPTFKVDTFTGLTDTSVIVVTGEGFSKAITISEAKVSIQDVPCNIKLLEDDKLILGAPSSRPTPTSKSQSAETADDTMDLVVQFGDGKWIAGKVSFTREVIIPLPIIIPAVIVPMLVFIAISIYCYRRKSQQAEREYEKVKHQLENLEESVRDRCKKEFTDLMIEMEDHTSDLSEGRIPFLDYKTYTDRNFFLPSKEGDNDPMITGKIQIPESRRATVTQALNQFSNLLNSKPFLINFIRTLESRPDFNARNRGNFASLLTVALHGKLEYYTDIMRTLLLELMDEHVQNKNPKLMLRRSETVVERMLCNWMSICLYQFLRDSAGEPLYKLYKALKHQVEKGPVDARLKKAKYTLNDTGLLGDDVEYAALTLQVLVHGEGPDVTPVKVLNCDTITQVKEKIIDQVYRNLPYSQRPKAEGVALEWRPGSTGQILSDMDLTSQTEGRWKRLNTLAHYNVRDNATLVLSKVLHTQSFHQHQDSHDEKNALLEDDNTFHLVRPTDEIDEVKSKRGSMKDKAMTKAITEIYLTRLLSVKGTLQQFVDNFFRSVLCTTAAVPPAVKYFFDFLDEQAERHDNVDEETLHIWKTNSLPMRFWVNILRNPQFILDVHVTEVVDASLHVIGQTFMDACTKTEHKLSRESPSNKLLYAKEISTYKKMVDDYYRGIRQMVPVSDQDMNTHLAEVSRQHTDKLNTQVALHQLYQYASKYFDLIIQSLDEDPAAQNRQLTLRLQQVAAALENKVTDL
ncbi:PREDICTED: plexin-B2-like isoform X2 [Poecilia mexicana]|uniref:plexin-B2-like isoform X2 n=1 Tax=Poecilia mexicana TaxID=48701 RepID=UPI00072E07D3|nr:PREDICTED: plexin-B2-like isoform X2 [Poecilia mexicana]